MLRRLSLPPGPALPAPVYSSGGMDLLRSQDSRLKFVGFRQEHCERVEVAARADGRGVRVGHQDVQSLGVRPDDIQAGGRGGVPFRGANGGGTGGGRRWRGLVGAGGLWCRLGRRGRGLVGARWLGRRVGAAAGPGRLLRVGRRGKRWRGGDVRGWAAGCQRAPGGREARRRRTRSPAAGGAPGPWGRAGRSAPRTGMSRRTCIACRSGRGGGTCCICLVRWRGRCPPGGLLQCGLAWCWKGP